MMGIIKLTDEQYDLLQAYLIKDELNAVSNTPKFIDIKARYIDGGDPNAVIKQVSIRVYNINALINFELNGESLTEIRFTNYTSCGGIVCNLTIDEIKEMIREA